MDFESLSADLHRLRDRALAEISRAADPAALDELQIGYLGKKGEITAVLRGIGSLPPEDRPRFGALANEIGEAVKDAVAERGAVLRSAAQARRLASETVDVTLPGRPIARGTLHPIPETIAAIAEVFGQFGFVVYEGPEVEDDLTNFQMLNIAPDHPARDLWDTLYVDIPGYLLRTHTSPGQIRVMKSTPPPISSTGGTPRAGTAPSRGAAGRSGDESEATPRRRWRIPGKTPRCPRPRRARTPRGPAHPPTAPSRSAGQRRRG